MRMLIAQPVRQVGPHASSLSVNSKARQHLFGWKSVFGTVRRMTDEMPDYMTDEVPEYTADELGDHDDLLAEGRLGHVEHIGARWRTGFVRYEPDGHSMTVRLVAEGTPQGDTAITDLVVAEAVAIVQQVASVNHVYLELTVRSDNTITHDGG